MDSRAPRRPYRSDYCATVRMIYSERFAKTPLPPTTMPKRAQPNDIQNNMVNILGQVINAGEST